MATIIYGIVLVLLGLALYGMVRGTLGNAIHELVS